MFIVAETILVTVRKGRQASGSERASSGREQGAPTSAPQRSHQPQSPRSWIDSSLVFCVLGCTSQAASHHVRVGEGQYWDVNTRKLEGTGGLDHLSHPLTYFRADPPGEGAQKGTLTRRRRCRTFWGFLLSPPERFSQFALLYFGADTPGRYGHLFTFRGSN